MEELIEYGISKETLVKLGLSLYPEVFSDIDSNIENIISNITYFKELNIPNIEELFSFDVTLFFTTPDYLKELIEKVGVNKFVKIASEDLITKDELIELAK